MHAIRATWTNGQIVPAEPVDWPEGSELVVRPVVPTRPKIGLSEDEWRDDEEAIADWTAWIATIEPMELADDERAEIERSWEEHRRFNLEAVRRQMEEFGKEP